MWRDCGKEDKDGKSSNEDSEAEDNLKLSIKTPSPANNGLSEK